MTRNRLSPLVASLCLALNAALLIPVMAQPAALSADAVASVAVPGDHRLSLIHGGLERAYLVHVPPGYRPTVPTPLLVSLHGGGGSMDFQARESNYGQTSKADREGFIVVFPNGFSRLPGGRLATWNAGRCCGPARDKDIDDVGFIREMVGQLESQLNIDRRRIFATGMSNGGMMAQRLACEMSDTFRAIAAVAATDNTVDCRPARPVAVLQIHAKDDDHVPFDGGRGAKSLVSAITAFTSVPETVSRWVGRDRCDAAPRRVLEVEGAYCETHRGCDGGVEVELCVTDVGGHSWPGMDAGRGATPSKALSANDVMWDFFMRQPVHAR